jgi:plastocyanin
VKRCVLVGAFALAGTQVPARLDAMPVFAQAYGYDCQKCHIQVPALNSFGRYVQRTMYAVLDRRTLARGVPLWIGETTIYDTQDPNEPHHVQFGNLAVHAVGYLDKNVTYHIQQWLSQSDNPGGLDTAWVSYDHIVGPAGHLTIGKQPPPGPSFFSQWSDFSPFAVPSITVGEHAQGLQNNRWGAKLGYAGPRFTADAGWFGSSADLNGATDFSPSNDKTFQWDAAYAPSDGPLQVGAYGNVGTFPLAEGGVDRYSALALYAQLDPSERWPGGLFLVQRGRDSNPGQGAPSATSSGYSAAIFWHPLRHWESLISLRHELTNDGLHTITQTNNADFSIRIARYVHATFEAATATGGKPAWRYFIWWTTPMRSALPPLPEQAGPGAAPPGRTTTLRGASSGSGAAPAASGATPAPSGGTPASSGGTTTTSTTTTTTTTTTTAAPPASSAAATHATAASAGSAAHVVHTKNFAYIPPSVTIKVGETVQFVNDDATQHTVTASDKSFDSGNMNQNATWSHVFAKAGTYPYICTYHPYMKGTIVVRSGSGRTSAVRGAASSSGAKPAASGAAPAHSGTAPSASGTTTTKTTTTTTTTTTASAPSGAAPVPSGAGAARPSTAPAASGATPAASGTASAHTTASAGSGAHVVHTKDFAYIPPTLTIKVGETVQFVNDDATPHTVTASDKSFDSANMDQNATWSHVFAKAGTYPYICTYHPYMKGTIIVR